MYKLYQLNLPSNFLRLLCSFLSNRSLSVHVEGCKSRPISLRAGTPQGSCLSPILFSIHVNDIPFIDMVGCQPSQYADDTGLWSTGKDHNYREQHTKSTQLHGELVQEVAGETVSIKDKCGPFHQMLQGSYGKTTAVPLWRRAHLHK